MKIINPLIEEFLNYLWEEQFGCEEDTCFKQLLLMGPSLVSCADNKTSSFTSEKSTNDPGFLSSKLVHKMV